MKQRGSAGEELVVGVLLIARDFDSLWAPNR